MPTVASLSSIPSRFSRLPEVLTSLLDQDIGFDEVRLYLPKRYRRFPDYDGSLPAVPKGVRIIQVEEDLGPASKVLFAAKDLAGSDCDIFYCDDDHIYAPHRVSRMVAQRAGRLDHCITASYETLSAGSVMSMPSHRPGPVLRERGRAYHLQKSARTIIARMINRPFLRSQHFFKPVATGGYVDIALGVGGVLVRPEFFDDQFYDIPPILWTVDDYWLSGNFARKGVPIWVVANFTWPMTLGTSTIDALYLSAFDGADRQAANAACVRYMQETYGVWQP